MVGAFYSMKLLHCTKCCDVVRIQRTGRICTCGASWSRYLKDGNAVVFLGPARVLEIKNDEWDLSLLHPDKVRKWTVVTETAGVFKVYEKERAPDLAS